ncbi:MAG: Adenylate cyclase [Labilithrix sp.]|nr:Adenylate cyclase [Labilithrix sp.]
MRALRRLILALVAALAACSSQTRDASDGQIVLHFDTDAPLAAGPTGTTALFDRLRVDLFSPGSDAPCAGCTNEFEVDHALFAERRASIGIVPPLGVSGYRARVRLFRRAFADESGEPNPEASIDVTVALPVVTEGNVSDVTVSLGVDDFGPPRGSPAAPVDPILGRLARSAVGTWPGAKRVECTGTAPEGALCVPGGAFWMGTPNPAAFSPLLFFTKPRLVVLDPFYMSASEVTVRQMRAAGRAAQDVWSGSTKGLLKQDWCTFTTAPGKFEDYPVTCVSFTAAHDYCEALGGLLPTEAQFEYVAGAMSGALFPWGQDEPTCTDAVFARAGYGQFASVFAPCMPPHPPGGPIAVGSGARDRVSTGGGTIADLAGNVGEWTRDLWNTVDEPCWKRAGIYHDPWCTTVSPSMGSVVAFRGGTWVHPASSMESHARNLHDPAGNDVDLGFRCVWPAR